MLILDESAPYVQCQHIVQEHEVVSLTCSKADCKGGGHIHDFHVGEWRLCPIIDIELTFTSLLTVTSIFS